MSTDDLNLDFLTIPQGGIWRRAWPIIDADTGEPVDITGATARAQVRAFPSAAETLYEWTILNGGVEIDTVNSWVILNTPAAVSAVWTWTHGYYDILLTELGGNVVRVVQGTITVDLGVTR